MAATVAALLASACKTSSADDGGTDDDGNPTVNSVCVNVAPIHSVAQCDKCTRDLCCPEVLACEQATSCKELTHCYAKCATGDRPCFAACRDQFGTGDPELAPINACAVKNCPIPCGGAVIEPTPTP